MAPDFEAWPAIVLEVERAYVYGKGKWTGPDWAHPVILDGRVVSEDGEQILCDGDIPGCEACPTITDAATQAEERAAMAVRQWRRGDIAAAYECARGASDFESEYGDNPTWGRLLRALDDAKKWVRAWVFNRYDDDGPIELRVATDEVLDFVRPTHVQQRALWRWLKGLPKD